MSAHTSDTHTQSTDGGTVHRVAVLGLGTLGSAVAQRPIGAGLEVTVWNRTPSRVEAFRAGPAAIAATPSEAVRGADAVVTLLFDAGAVRETMATALPALSPGAIWMQSSTIGPAAATECAARAESVGVRFVDAPLLGTRDPALQGRLTVLFAGAPDTRRDLAPVLDAVSMRVVSAGSAAPQASALKLAANAWIATLTAGIGQSLTIAQNLGVDPALFLEAIHGTAMDSAYAQLKGVNILNRRFAAQFAVAGILKDIRLARAETPQLPGVLLQALEELYDQAVASGHGGEDIAAVWSSFQLGRDAQTDHAD